MKKTILIFAVFLSLISCTKKEVNETTTPEPIIPAATSGTITVWTKRTDLGIITVTCNGQTKNITSIVTTSPSCGASGCANFSNLPFAQYNINIVTGNSSGNKTYTLSNECYRIEVQ